MKAGKYYWKRSLKGSSLIYSLLISLLVSGLLSAYLLADLSHRGLVNRKLSELKVQGNIRSAMVLALDAAQMPMEQGTSWISGPDSAWLSFEDWGGYKLVRIRARHHQAISSMSALVGQKLPEEKSCLVLSDEGYPLVLGGDARIRGSVSVPKGEIQTERIAGQAFSGSKPSPTQISFSTKLEQSDFPKMPWQIKRILDSIQGEPIKSMQQVIEEEIAHSWEEGKKLISAAGKLYITGGKYKGKIMFLARESIEVDAQASLEDVILVAPIIKVHNGVRGRFQVFASDSLLLGDNVQLQFPSFLALSAKPDRPAILDIQAGCRIEGAVLFYQPIDSTPPSPLRPQVSIGKGSTIYGTLHVAGNLALDGVVGGMVIAQGFVLRTAVGSVRNHLLNAQLLEDRLAPAYAGPFILEGQKKAILQIYHHEKKETLAARE